MNKWHPLQPYIEQVKKRAEEISDLESVKTKLLDPDIKLCNNFGLWMNLIISNGDSKDDELIKIFEPLKVTGYNEYALFKYRSYIELNDMGYGGDFFELYNGLYRECRSVVFDLSDLSVALASISKFKNYGEEATGEWSEESIQKSYLNCDMFSITEKMDGSYQQYRWLSKEQKVIGSGSQALDADESWRLERGFKLLDSNYKAMLSNYPWLTFCFEFISPDNPVVVKYTKEQEGLYLFAARDVTNGGELDYATLEDIAKTYNVKYVKNYDNETLTSLLNQLDKYTSDEKEGWVVSIWNKIDDLTPFRFKVKVDDYVLMHKALSKSISPNAIIQAIAENRIDDFKSKIPVAYKDLVESIENDIYDYLRNTKYYTELIYKAMEWYLIPNASQKEAMIWINKIPEIIRGYVRNLYLERPNYYLNKSNRENFGYYHLGEIQKKKENLDKKYSGILKLIDELKNS